MGGKLRHPRKLRYPKWWALEKVEVRLNIWPFLVSMLDFWGVHWWGILIALKICFWIALPETDKRQAKKTRVGCHHWLLVFQGHMAPCIFWMIEILGVWYPAYQIPLRRVLAKDWCSVLWQGAYPWKYAGTPGNELLGWRCLEDLLKLQQVNLLRILDRSPLVPNGSNFLHNHIQSAKRCPVHIQIKGLSWIEDWTTPTRKPREGPLS